ncbi:putative carbohydrate kinase [Klebsiella pneumoniae subsp. ozaenae]|uniref:Putative carbohydrate kinase n=1 Tax=Klebsiella pneumoniae subsp. ozaenae TaxID=574 RepID=A0A377Z5X5_KLEPO|nr:putative carbohydrate kinase [Klebsiella pneumoniae subsp. ozaenae]
MQATAKEFIIALDEGTTNAKAVVLDSRAKLSSNSRSRWRSKRRATAGWSNRAKRW